MKKKIAILCTAAIAAGACLGSGLPASAKDYLDNSPYEIRMVPQRTFVTAEEVAAGDVVIPAAVYLRGSTAYKMASAAVKYRSSSNDVYFRNLRTGADTDTGEMQSYTVDGTTFSTDLLPYCFGTLKDGVYQSGSPRFTDNRYACDKIYGKQLYSAGDHKVRFEATYFTAGIVDEETGKMRPDPSSQVTKEFVCDVTENDDGSGTYSYNYIESGTFAEKTMTAVIPHYDPALPEGSLIPDASNSVIWVCGLSSLSSGVSFLGGRSDELPFFTVDIVISKGTANGIYDVDFVTEKSADILTPTGLSDPDNKDFLYNAKGCSIAVGVTGASVQKADTSLQNAAFYMAEDTRPIQASDFADQIIADVTYADGSVDNLDITRLVDVNGNGPDALYDLRGDKGYFNAMTQLYFNGKPLTDTAGELVAQRILVGQQGDIDLNGTVDTNDAFKALEYFSATGSGQSSSFHPDKTAAEEQLAYYLGDSDTLSTGFSADTPIDTNDAYCILECFSAKGANLNYNWAKNIK